jgi:hypothetical protein
LYNTGFEAGFSHIRGLCRERPAGAGFLGKIPQPQVRMIFSETAGLDLAQAAMAANYLCLRLWEGAVPVLMTSTSVCLYRFRPPKGNERM